MPEDQDRFTIEYEVRHSFQTMAIGQPLKLTVVIQTPLPEVRPPQKTIITTTQQANCENVKS